MSQKQTQTIVETTLTETVRTRYETTDDKKASRFRWKRCVAWVIGSLAIAVVAQLIVQWLLSNTNGS